MGKINFEGYQRQTTKTSLYRSGGIKLSIPALGYLTMGLMGESGEVAEKIKKIFRDGGGKVDVKTRELLGLELGDVLWYISEICTELGLKMGDVAKANIDKLASRRKRGVVHGSGDKR